MRGVDHDPGEVQSRRVAMGGHAEARVCGRCGVSGEAAAADGGREGMEVKGTSILTLRRV